VVSGREAGLAAALLCGVDTSKDLKEAQAQKAALPGPAKGSGLVTAPGIGKGGKTFICFDEDATVKHIAQSVDAGLDVPEHAKRFTATGTGAGQGGIPGHNLPLLMAEMSEAASRNIMPTTIRPPLTPTLFSTYAAGLHNIVKRTALHELQIQAGGLMRQVGVWQRARYFSQDLTSKDEILNVRNNVGMIDVSTLGKFRIFGPDAEKALNRVYVGDMTKVPMGRMKYSAMVNEDGNLVDDGVVTKVGENDYYFTASTARAGMTIEWIRYHARYDGWKFNVVNLTDALGAINLAGPNARAVLAKLTDADLSPAAFPYMAYREILIGGKVPARVMRVGFVGELSYEIHLPNSMTRSVWEWLMEAGKEFGIRPFGLEAQNQLRMEKGHVIIGQESEIRTTLHDLNLGWTWHRHKPEAKAVGAMALKMTEHQENRLKLVGIQMDNPAQTPGDGSLIVDSKIRGFICTSRFSHTLKQSIGLALVDAPLAKEGTSLLVFQDNMGDMRWTAKVIKTPFYDPEGQRQKM
jgi:sarcosine oxidase subunit alpha